MQHYIKPGMKLIDVCEHLEDTARKLVGEKGMEAGTVCVCQSCVIAVLLM